MKFQKVGKIKDISYETAEKITKLLEAKGLQTEKFITYANKLTGTIDCNLTIYRRKLRTVCSMYVSRDNVDIDKLSL